MWECYRLVLKNMLSKLQKIWLWIFGAMFLVPEILFLNIFSYVSVIFFSKEIPTIFSLISKNYSFSPVVFLFIVAIEILGVLGLFIFFIKLNKKTLSILAGIVLLWLLFIFWFINALSHISLVW